MSSPLCEKIFCGEDRKPTGRSISIRCISLIRRRKPISGIRRSSHEIFHQWSHRRNEAFCGICWLDREQRRSRSRHWIYRIHDEAYWQALESKVPQMTCFLPFHGPYVNIEAASNIGSEENVWLMESYKMMAKQTSIWTIIMERQIFGKSCIGQGNIPRMRTSLSSMNRMKSWHMRNFWRKCMNWEAGWKKEKHFLEILSNESARRL